MICFPSRGARAATPEGRGPGPGPESGNIYSVKVHPERLQLLLSRTSHSQVSKKNYHFDSERTKEICFIYCVHNHVEISQIFQRRAHNGKFGSLEVAFFCKEDRINT